MEAEWLEWLRPPHVYGALAGIFVALFAALRWWERRRSDAVEEVARRLGFTFARADRAVPGEELSSFALFGHGRGRRAMNVMRGARGRDEIVVFGYRYRVGSGRHSRTYTQTVVAVRRPGRNLPRFRIEPENLMSRVAITFGGQDIDFVEAPTFSARYRLRGRSESELREAFSGRGLDEFARSGDWEVEGEGEWLIAYRTGRRIRATDLPALIDDVQVLARWFD